MKNIDQKIDVIADFCSKRLKKNDRVFAKAIGELLGSMYTDEQNKEKNIDDFIKVLKNKNKQVNEGVGDMLKGMTAGALLAMCLINPAYSKTIVDNIQTHHPVTAKYESGDKGYDCIVKDNYGGYSYGKDQISTERRNGNPSTFDYFMKYAKEKDPNIEYHLRKAGGWEAANKGDKAFINKWREMTYRKDFRDVYDGFLKDREFVPVYNRMDSSNAQMKKITNWASNNRAVQAALHSTIIQHGKNGAFNLIKKASNSGAINTPEQFIKKLYDCRSKKFPKYKSRYKNECSDVLSYLKHGDTKIAMK
jgi:hypothetical protein